MKALITVLTLFTASLASAGVTGPVAMETVLCKGDGIQVSASFIAGMAKLNAEAVFSHSEKHIRITDKDFMNDVMDLGLIGSTDWDKTLWYKGIGIDIKNVSDHMVFISRQDNVEFIGGGKVEYQALLPISNLPLEKLHQVVLGQQPKNTMSVTTSNYAGEIQLNFTVVQSGVKKCTQTKTVPNPYKLDGDTTSPATIETCVSYEQVAAPQVIENYSKSFPVNATCNIVSSLL